MINEALDAGVRVKLLKKKMTFLHWFLNVIPEFKQSV